MARIFILLVVTLVGALADEAALREFAEGNHQFTAAVYKELLKENTGNFLVSPLSAETVLALTYEGTKGATADELVQGLKLPSTREKTQAAFKSLLPNLKKDDNNTKLLSANKIYVAEAFNIKDEFKKIAVNVYNSDVEKVNFAESAKSAQNINGWVEDNTNKKIRDLIKADSLNSDVKMVLVNALYFSGKWQNQFELYQTFKEKFFKTEKDSVDVDMMHIKDNFNYYENKELDAKFLELPYLGNEVTMTIVLPNKKEGLTSLEAKAEELFKPQNYSNERVDVALPRFTIETEIKFIPILKSLGIKKAFDAQEADLSGLGESKDNLYISDVIQKAFINVTESGTEAAAATAVTFTATSLRVSPEPEHIFKANHPFVYLIKQKSVVLFTGRVNTLK